MEEWTASDSLRKHMLREAAVVAYARRYGADEDLWAATACCTISITSGILRSDRTVTRLSACATCAKRAGPKLCLAILGHAGDELGVKRESDLARVLYACDEITGLITAAVLVRPDRDISQLKLSSLKKKYRSKAFAAGVNRADVERGAEELGVDLWEHIGFVVEAMQSAADRLGLDGRLAAD